MKLLTSLSLLVSAIIQTSVSLEQVKMDLKAIKTSQQAEAYISKSKLKGNVLELSEIRDSSVMAQKLYRMKAGEVIEQASADKSTTYLYKALTSKSSEADRVQYIYFDNTKLAKKKIDSLRQVIMERLKKGDKFTTLARQYSMDHNGKRGGDLGWYEGKTMAPGFVSAVRAHSKGDVFLVDLPKERWYYVVRKSHDPVKWRRVIALYLAVPSK